MITSQHLSMMIPRALAGRAAALLLAGGLAVPCAAQQPGQRTFPSPEAAGEALAAASRSNDEQELLRIFGPDGQRIVASGDDVEDARSRANFVARYGEMHRLVKEPDGRMVLVIGPHNWPTPIPIVGKGGSWWFDTVAGRKEILVRRIGRNELSTIRVCRELVAAQKEYCAGHDHEYAQTLASDEGRNNGLYWKTGEGQAPSPIGPLLAAAGAGGAAGAATPYRGYFFRLLTRQGPDCAGGAKDYLQNGKLTGGFAFVAYPAVYRSSGVMTFLVNQEGVVYERDLGANTESRAKAMKAFNPSEAWRKAETSGPETLKGQGAAGSR